MYISIEFARMMNEAPIIGYRTRMTKGNILTSCALINDGIKVYIHYKRRSISSRSLSLILNIFFFLYLSPLHKFLAETVVGSLMDK